MNGELWRDVAARLRDEIVSGAYQPGDTVPGEFDLAEQSGVSRDTARRALTALTQEGLLTAGRGRLGRQVRDSKPLVFYAVHSESRDRAGQRRDLGTDAWVTDAAEQGRLAGQKISVAIEDAGKDMARRLEIAPGAGVVVRRRLRTLDGVPHDLADTYYPADIAEGTPIAHPADVTQGVIALMADLGYVQVRFEDEVGARMPTPAEAQALRMPPGVPVLVQYRTGWTETRPVKVTVTIWPADRVRLLWQFEG